MAVTKAKWMRDSDGGEPTTIEAEIDGQTVSVPADPGNRHYAEIRAAVGAGELALEDPDPEPAPDPYRPLSRRQFAWMLDFYGLEPIWKGVHADAKGAGNRALAANLRALEESGEYYLDNTLGFLAQVRDQPKVAASGIDLSDDAIRGYWRHAAVQTFESLTDVVPAPPAPG